MSIIQIGFGISIVIIIIILILYFIKNKFDGKWVSVDEPDMYIIISGKTGKLEDGGVSIEATIEPKSDGSLDLIVTMPGSSAPKTYPLSITEKDQLLFDGKYVFNRV